MTDFINMSEIICNTGNGDLDLKVNDWLRLDKNLKTCSEVGQLVQDGKFSQLKKIMLKRLAFGTAGIRGRMGPGYACLNDLVIIQTSQGLAKYLVSICPEALTKGIVIGYDSRHNSWRFARLAASAFLSCGIPVYLLGHICPTPFVPFTIVQLKAAAGVMVTASHNPKEDNGYKVYWDNGAQIIPPHDEGIQNSILENLEPFEGVWDIDNALSDPKLSNPFNEMSEKYYARLSSSMLDVDTNANSHLKFTFTAMHGVGHEFMVKAFETCSFKPGIPVVEQMVPDPEFPTVKFPNPEEGKSALDLSFKTANENDSKIILANDPDADRLAVAEKLRSGMWNVFTGNEEGALFGWWSWHRHKKLSPDVPASDVYMIASTVSSKILRAIAKKEGFNFVETLTGFKWMGNKAHEFLLLGKTVLFAFEEAIGFMNGSEVLDKDGISAAMRLSEMASYLEQKQMTLHDQLQWIYKEYGYHAAIQSYYICSDQGLIKSMFDKIRNFDGPDTYPSSVGEGRFIIKDVRDLTTGYDSSRADKKAILPSSASCQMLTFTFANGCVVTLRTSGTEPKIKYYSEIIAEPGITDWASLKEELRELINCVVEELLEPKKNNLTPKMD